MVKALVFDLDGTLLDTLEDIKDAMNMTLVKYGYHKRSLLEMKSFLGNGAIKLTERALGEKVSEELFTEILNDYRLNYLNNLCIKTKPFKNILKMLENLKSKGYFLGVISNKPDLESQNLLEIFFKDVFDYQVGSKDEVSKKPDPEALEIMANKFNLKKEEIVYIGDSHVDSEFAENFGCKYYLFTHGYEKQERLMTLKPLAFLDDAMDLIKEIEKGGNKNVY